MTFAWPHLLWLLVVPLGWLIWDLTHRRGAATGAAHPKILRAEAGSDSLTLASATSSSLGVVSRGARPWLCLGLACAIVAVARPQWGRLEEPVFDQSREILIAIDLSRSMLAPDVKPTRLDRAKLLIQSLLEKLAGERVGLVVFSGTAFLQSPLSSDYEILREFLPSLTPEFLPQGGSNYAAMLEAAAQAFSNSTADRFLVVLSDGESTEPEWRSRLAEFKNKNIRVLGLGIGTPAGSMIPDESGGFVKDERGAVVLSKLESSTLQELATTTGGAYRDASTWIDLAALVNETIDAGRKGEFVEKNTVRLVERFQWPLALGLCCLLVSLCYEFPVRPRPRNIALRTQEQGARSKEQEKAVLGGVASVLLLLAPCSLLLPVAAHAAATLAPPATNAAPLPSALSRIVGRLSTADSASARDWAELARETVTWGSKLQSEQQPVPEGPVRDALQAVDLGAKEDAKTADWPKLREELEALLKKPEPQKQEDQSQDKNESKDQNKDQQQQRNQQKQDDSKSKDQQPAKPQSSSEPQNREQQKQNQPQDQKAPPPDEQPPKPGESAFGDMKEKSEAPPPPPPSGEMQKVGGAPEKKEPPPESANPALAVPMQKLEQLRNQDSPARLFELMQGENKSAPKKPAKDW